MKISELLAALQAVKDKHGDLPVYIESLPSRSEVSSVFREYSGELEGFAVILD